MAGLSAPALATPFPTAPDDLMQRIAVQSALCSGTLAPFGSTYCAVANGPTLAPGSLSVAGGPFPPQTASWAGSMSANTMSGVLASNSQIIHMWMSMRDTYTLESPTLAPGTPVNLVLNFSGHAFLREGLFSRAGVFAPGTAVLQLEIGSWALDPRPGERCSTTDPTCQFSDQFRVQAASTRTLGNPANGVNEEVSGTLSRTITALVGTPFEVAFGFNLQGGLDFTVDATSTGVIDWDLPIGTTLTSVLGWTDPDAIVVAVPTPATLPLLLLGLSALAAVSHRRRRAAA